MPSFVGQQCEAQRLHDEVTVQLRRRDKQIIVRREALIKHLVDVIDNGAELSDWLMNEARHIAGTHHATTHLL